MGNNKVHDSNFIGTSVTTMLPLSSGNVLWVGQETSSKNELVVYTESTREWSSNPLGTFNATVSAIAEDSTYIYVGGNFTTINSATYNYIVRWNKSTSVISALSTQGLNGQCGSIAVNSSGTTLYAVGDFTSAGGTTGRNRVARWNGTTWSAMGTGLNSTGTCVLIDGATNFVYVGGHFTTAGGVSCNRVAMWNGTTWSALGSGLNGSVRSIAIYNNLLYVGGDFSTAGGISANRIACYNLTTTTWSALGSGITGTGASVYCLEATNNGKIIAGGTFTAAGGVSVLNVAMWNGSTWSAMSTGVGGGTDVVYTATTNLSNSAVYVGGAFMNAGGLSNNVYNVAKWSGSGTI